MTDVVVEPMLLEAGSAAGVLGIPESSLRRLAQHGDIPHRRLGRRLRFTRADLAAYVETLAVAPSDTPAPSSDEPVPAAPAAPVLQTTRPNKHR